MQRTIEEIAMTVADRVLASEPVQSLLEADGALSPLVKPMHSEDLLKGLTTFAVMVAVFKIEIIRHRIAMFLRPTAGRHPGYGMEHLEWQGPSCGPGFRLPCVCTSHRKPPRVHGKGGRALEIIQVKDAKTAEEELRKSSKCSPQGTALTSAAGACGAC